MVVRRTLASSIQSRSRVPSQIESSDEEFSASSLSPHKLLEMPTQLKQEISQLKSSCSLSSTFDPCCYMALTFHACCHLDLVLLLYVLGFLFIKLKANPSLTCLCAGFKKQLVGLRTWTSSLDTAYNYSVVTPTTKSRESYCTPTCKFQRWRDTLEHCQIYSCLPKFREISVSFWTGPP